MIVEIVEAKSISEIAPGRCRLAFDAYWNGKLEPQYFLWSCPVCGHAWSGWLVGPKSSPFTHVWMLAGSRERPTLSPSMVCAMARPEVANGRPLCSGHGFISNGEWIGA